GQALATIRGSNPLWVLTALVVYYMSFPVRAIRWARLLREGGTRIGGGDLLEILLLGWFVNCLVPAKLGDLYRSYLVKRRFGVSLSRTVGVVVAERLLDLFAVFGLLIVVGYIAFGRTVLPDLTLMYVSAVALGVLIVVGFIALYAVAPRIAHLFPGEVRRIGRLFREGVVHSFRALPVAGPLTLLVWFFEAGRLMCVLAALGLTLPPSQVVFVAVQPGFTDAFYYASVARRLAHGEGLTADFVWNFIEAPNFAPLPVPSHRFWMPLTSVVQAVGIVALEPALGTFRAAQAAIVAVGAFVPAAAYLAALATGGAWLARGVSLGASPDLMGRTALLARYEDFFAIRPTGTADLATAVGVRVAALASDLGLVVISLVLFLVVPLALALRARWRLPAVRAFAGLALLLYLVESLVWTLHATRGSYFHSLAALFPFAMALAAVGGEIFFAARAPGLARVAVAGTLGASSILALFALALWGSTYNASYKARSAALDAIPPGPFLAIDAAALRWIADR